MTSSQSIQVAPQFTREREFFGLGGMRFKIEQDAVDITVVPHIFPDFFRVELSCVDRFGCTDRWMA